MIRARQECDARREEHLKELIQEHTTYEDSETRINIEHLEDLYEESDNGREGIFGRALAETCEDALEDEDPEEGSFVVLYHPGGTERYWRPSSRTGISSPKDKRSLKKISVQTILQVNSLSQKKIVEKLR